MTERTPFRRLPLPVKVVALLVYALALTGLVGVVSLAAAGVLFVWRHWF